MDYRDLVIRMFADDERQRLEWLASVEDDRDVYRALAQQTIHALHDLTCKHQSTCEQLARARDENRHLRAEIMRQAAVA